MEQTLGKRIAEHRKLLKLTQDQLAEKLGITAQAVSKWENDQSCPDITMLPRLAEIFGTTTDELLGREAPHSVHQAEIVEESAKDEPHWEFHYDSGRRGAIAFALLVLAVGVLTLLSKYFYWGLGLWDFLWPCAMLVYGIKGLIGHFSVFRLGLALFGGYFLVEKLGIWSMHLSGELILPIIIVALGISLLLDALKKPKRSSFRFLKNGRKVEGSKHFSLGEQSFSSTLSFGEEHHRVALDVLSEGQAQVSFGELTLDLSGCQSVADGCTLELNCSFGELTLLVPSRFRVDSDASTAFANMEVHGHPDPDAQGVIRLDANVSFGEVQLKYI